MILAAISDVHSNLTALNEAVKIAEDCGAEKIVAAGDFVGKGPQPFEVLELLYSKEVTAVKGNADEKFLKSKLIRNKLAGREKRLLEWLKSLPKIYSNGGFTVCHGSPAGVTDYIYPSINEFALKQKLRNIVKPKVLFCGHSHIPFVKQVGEVLVVNCGSVGKPIDGDPRGSLALVRDNGEIVEAEIIRFGYELPKFESIMIKEGFSKKRARQFIEGRKTF